MSVTSKWKGRPSSSIRSMRPSCWPRAPIACAVSASWSQRTRRLSLIEVARLTDVQRAGLAEYGERWSRLRQTTARVDRDEAEEGVRRAYAAAGLTPPRHVIWGESPYEIAHKWARYSSAGE